MEGAASRDSDGPGFDALRGLVDALPAVIYEAEPGAEGRWRYVSAHIETLLGYSPEEWIADPALYVRSLHPDDREAVVRVESRELEAARGGDVTAVTEHRMIRPGCLYRSEPGAAGRWKFLSPQIESLVGYSAGELMSDPRLRVGLVHPDDRDWVLSEEAESAAEPGRQWVHEYRLLHRRGDQVWVRDRGVVSGTPEGPRTIEGILTDITATHEASGGDATVPDVYRLSCPKCGSVWASERVEACSQCGNSEVDEVSLDATLHELANVSGQLDGLLDGIQGHLEMLKMSLPDAVPPTARPRRAGHLRIVTPLHEDPDVL